MKHWHIGIAVLGAFLLGQVFAQEDKVMQWTPPDWMKKTTVHDGLEKTVGEFIVKTEMFIEPGKPPMVAAAAATRKSIKNGFFVREDFKGNFMGMAFEGTLIQGYDPFRKKHVSVWFDNGSPIMGIRHGEEKDGKLTMEGSDPDAYLNKIVPMKSVVETKDGQTVISFYRVLEGKDVIHMRLTYTAKK